MADINLRTQDITHMPEARVEAAQLIDENLRHITPVNADGEDYFTRTGIDVVIGAFMADRLVGVTAAEVRTDTAEGTESTFLFSPIAAVAGDVQDGSGVGIELLRGLVAVAQEIGMTAIKGSPSDAWVRRYYLKRGSVDDPHRPGWMTLAVTADTKIS